MTLDDGSVEKIISTHALTEGDDFITAYDDKMDISTHALTEGDVNLDTFLNIWYISTHALTEGDVFLL